MPIKASNVAAAVAGMALIWSGITGTTISKTVHNLLSGNLTPDNTEGIGTPPTDPTGNASTGDVQSGTATQNYLTIANYLVENGYTKIAAAGICGCIAGESSGNPEANSGSGIGLIQWTGTNESMVPPLTGNASKDLQAQLPAILKYNNAQGAGLIQMLNQQSTPVAAADFYSQYFERPAVRYSDVVQSVANSVYASINVTGATSQAPTG